MGRQAACLRKARLVRTLNIPPRFWQSVSFEEFLEIAEKGLSPEQSDRLSRMATEDELSKAKRKKPTRKPSK